MKLGQVGAFAILIAAIVNAYSFSDMTSASVPVPAAVRSSNAGMTPDEESRIYGGESANIKKYPYMVSLRANGSDSDTFCGGTLIAPQYVLTSAQCTDWYLYDVYASFGSKHRCGRGSRKSEQIRVVEAFRHPVYDYDTSMVAHDVALFKLEKPPTYPPARLPSVDGSNSKPGMMATTLGWGMINNETESDTLQAVDVEIISNKECRKLYNTDGGIVDDSVICAGNGGGKDMCADDAGGPLVVDGVVVGIASAGSDKGCGILPGLYARVTYELDFVNHILNGGSTGNITEILTAGTSTFLDLTYTSQDASAMDSIDVE